MRRAKNGAGVVNMRPDDAQKVDLAISQYVYPDLVHGILLTLETGLLHVLNSRLHFTSQVISSSRFKPLFFVMHSYHDVAYTLYPIQKWQLRLGNLVSFFPTFFLVEDMACPRHWA